jgi:hypothetical protein
MIRRSIYLSALLLAWLVGSAAESPTASEEPCPKGPFETNRDMIAASLESLPTLPESSGRERKSETEPETWTLTDGVASQGGGGLAAPAREGEAVGLSARIEYDSKGYLARYTGTEAIFENNSLGKRRYSTRTVRPTVEQARNIACLVNQLLIRNVPPTKQRPAKKQGPSANPMEIVVSAPRRCVDEYSDGHWESLQLRVGSAYAPASPALSCSEVGRLEAQLSSALGAPFLPR